MSTPKEMKSAEEFLSELSGAQSIHPPHEWFTKEADRLKLKCRECCRKADSSGHQKRLWDLGQHAKGNCTSCGKERQVVPISEVL